MRSIHSHTAKMPDNCSPSSSINTHQQQQNSDIFASIQINEKQTINFRPAVLSPPIIIVGTHKNSLSNSFKNDQIKQKFEKIKEFVSNKVYSQHIVEPYFAIDTSTQDFSKSDELTEKIDEKPQEDIETLRKVIEAVSFNEPYMGEQLPLKWLRFEKSLEKLKNKGLFYASLSQVNLKIIVSSKSLHSSFSKNTHTLKRSYSQKSVRLYKHL